jgi:macrodomain Ter protein organizer (MatP/YcbG family)
MTKQTNKKYWNYCGDCGEMLDGSGTHRCKSGKIEETKAVSLKQAVLNKGTPLIIPDEGLVNYVDKKLIKNILDEFAQANQYQNWKAIVKDKQSFDTDGMIDVVAIAIEKTEKATYQKAKQEYQQLVDKREKLMNAELKEQVEQARQDERKRIFNLNMEGTTKGIKDMLLYEEGWQDADGVARMTKEEHNKTIFEVREWLMKDKKLPLDAELTVDVLNEFIKKFGKVMK